MAQVMMGILSTARGAGEVGRLCPHVHPGGEIAAPAQSASAEACTFSAGALWHRSLW